MKRLIMPVGLALLAASPGGAAAAVALHGAGSAVTSPTAAHVRAYERAYHEVSGKLGRRAPGRDIITDGISVGRLPTDAEVVSSISVLDRMLAAAVTPASTPTAIATAQGSTTGASGVPACASESGTNYSTGASNTNPSSGATGRYQITPSTASAYGCDLSTASGQDACAQTIYAHQGAGAWVGCGG